MKLKPETTIALIYFFLGITWIYFSDKLLLLARVDALRAAKFQTAKGCGYVTLTAALLYYLLRKFYRELNQRLSLLETQNRQLQDIAWMQSHVVRAPLTRIMGSVNLLRDADDLTPEEARQVHDVITSSAEELDTIIRNISTTAQRHLHEG